MERRLECRTDLILPLALRALQPQYQLLGSLGLLPQDGLGLTSESLLLAIVPGLSDFIIKLLDHLNHYIYEGILTQAR